MHVNFDPSTVSWQTFLSCQQGGGGGLYNYFKGDLFQRGSGIGSFFKGAMRYLVPLGRTLAQEGLDTGKRILGRLAEGDAPLDALIGESAKGIKNLIDRAAEKAKKRGQQGSGQPVKSINRGLVAPAPSQLVGKRARKQRVDSLGAY